MVPQGMCAITKTAVGWFNEMDLRHPKLKIKTY